MRLAAPNRARPRYKAVYKTAEVEKPCEQEKDAVAVTKAQAAKKRKPRKAAQNVEQESQKRESSKSKPAAKKRRTAKRAEEQDYGQDPISAALQLWVDSLDAEETTKRKAKSKKAKPAARQTRVKQVGTKPVTQEKKEEADKVDASAATAAKPSKNDNCQAAKPRKVCKAKEQGAVAAGVVEVPRTEAKPSSSKSAPAVVEQQKESLQQSSKQLDLSTRKPWVPGRIYTYDDEHDGKDGDDDLEKQYKKLVMLDPSKRDPVQWEKVRGEMCKRRGINPAKRGYDPPDSAFLPGAYKRWCINCEAATDNKTWTDVDKFKSTGRCPLCYKMNYGYYHY